MVPFSVLGCTSPFMPGSTPGSPFLPGCSWLPRTENALLRGLLSFWGTKISRSVLNRENRQSGGRFCQKPSRYRRMCWCIVMVQQPAVVGLQLWLFSHDRSPQRLEHLRIVCSSVSLPHGTQRFKIIPQQSKNVTITAFVCDSDVHAFFVRGSSGVFHSRLCRCISESYPKI